MKFTFLSLQNTKVPLFHTLHIAACLYELFDLHSYDSIGKDPECCNSLGTNNFECSKGECFMCCFQELGQSPEVTQSLNAFVFTYDCLTLLKHSNVMQFYDTIVFVKYVQLFVSG